MPPARPTSTSHEVLEAPGVIAAQKFRVKSGSALAFNPGLLSSSSIVAFLRHVIHAHPPDALSGARHAVLFGMHSQKLPERSHTPIPARAALTSCQRRKHKMMRNIFAGTRC